MRLGRGHDDDQYALYVELDGKDVFSFHVEKGLVTGSAFPPELDVREIRNIAERMKQEGFGGWVLPALYKTLWFLGCRYEPDTRKIAALAALVRKWRDSDLPPVEVR